MGRSTTNTGTDTTDLADQVAQSLGMGQKKAGQQPTPPTKKAAKEKSVDISDQVGQSLGLKKKVGGEESSQESSPTGSPLSSLSGADRDKFIRQQYPEISNLHDSKFVDSVLDQNKDKNFVKRYLNPSEYPVINNGDGSYSTHRMASSDNIVYPTIVQQPDGSLKKLNSDGPNNEAYKYAIKHHEYIEFKNEKDADWFANNGYKLGSQLTGDSNKKQAIPSPQQASAAFQNKSITPEGVAVLAETDQGKKMGLNLLSPQERQMFANAHNGEKKTDVLNGVKSVVDTYYPPSNDPAKNKVRGQIINSVLSGNQSDIKKVRDNVLGDLQKKINDIQESAPLEQTGPSMGVGAPASMAHTPTPQQEAQIAQLKAQQERVRKTMDQYGVLSIVNSKETQLQSSAEIAGSKGKLDYSLAAQSIGEEKRKQGYGFLTTTPNVTYENEREGLEELMRNKYMEINEARAAGLPTKNKALLEKADKAEADFKTYLNIYNNLDNKFSDVGRYKTARYLGDILSETKPARLITTAQDVRDAAAIAEERNPGFTKTYGRYVDPIAASEGEGAIMGFLKPGDIPQGSFLGGVKTDIQDMADKIWGFKDNTATLGTSTTGAQPTKVVYDKENNAYRELKNEHYGDIDWNSSMFQFGKSVPQLVEFALLDKGLGAIARGVGEGGLAAINAIGKETNLVTNSLLGAKDLAEGYEAFKLPKGFERTMGLTLATYVTSYDDNKKYADSLIEGTSDMDEAKKTALANVFTLTSAALFKMIDYSPSKFVEKAFAKSAMPDVLEVLQKENFETLSKEGMTSILKDKLLPKVKAFAKAELESGKMGAKVGAISVLDQKIKDFVSLAVNPDKAQTSTADENMHTMVQQTLLMSLFGLPGAIYNGAFAPSTSDALHTAGLLAPQYLDRIDGMAERGEVTDKDAAGLKSIVKTMGEEVAKANAQTNDDGLPLTTGQKKKIALAGFRERAKAAMAENGQEVKGGGGDDPKDIKKENLNVKIEDTATFKSIRDEETGQKPATIADIDPTRTYYFEHSETPVTGAEIINHLNTGDLNETTEKTSGDNGEVSEAEKAKNPEGQDQKPAADQDQAPVAKAVVEQAITDGKIADNMAEHVRAKPEEFLQGVADQALGYMRQDGERVKSDMPDAEKGAREQYGDKVVDAALKIYPDNADEKGQKAPRGTIISEINNTLEDEYKSNMRKVQSGASPDARAKAVSELPQRLYERMAQDPSVKGNPERESQLQDIRERISKEGNFTEDALRNLSESELADASRRLLESFKSSLAVPDLPSEATQGRDKAALGETLQASYDRLIASGADPNETEMERLRERISTLLPKTTDNAQNEQKIEGVQRQEGGGRGQDARGPEDKENDEEKEEVEGEPKPEPAASGLGLSRDVAEIRANHEKSIARLEKKGDRMSEANKAQVKRFKDRIGVIDKYGMTSEDLMAQLKDAGKLKQVEGGYQLTLPDGSVKDFPDKDGLHQYLLGKDVNAKDILPPKPPEAEGGQKPSQPERPTVGINNAAVNESRLNRGLKPVVKEARRRYRDSWSRAIERVTSGMTDPRSYVAFLHGFKDITSQAFSDVDNAIVLMDRIDLTNQKIDALNRYELAQKTGNDNVEALAWQHMAEIEQKLQQNDEVADKMGTAIGRSLSSRRMLANLDYTLASMKKDIAKYYPKQDVPPEVIEKLKVIEKEHADALKKIAEYDEKFKQQQAEASFKKNVKKPDTQRGERNKKATAGLRELAQKIRTSETLANLGFTTAKGAEGAETAGMSLDLREAIAKGVEMVADLMDKGIEISEAIGRAIKEHVKEGVSEDEFKAGVAKVLIESGIPEKEINQPSVKDRLVQKITSLATNAKAESLTKDMITPVRQLINQYAKDGETDFGKALDQAFESIKGGFTDLTKDNLRNVYAGYGDVRLENENQLKKQLADWKKEATTLSQMKDVLEGKTPQKAFQLRKTGTTSEKVKKLRNDLQEKMKAAGISWTNAPNTPEEKNQRALQSLKTRLQNEINNLTRHIESKTPLPERAGVELDDEAKQLTERRDKLKVALAEITGDAGKKELTNEQRIERASSLLDKQIAGLNEDIAKIKNKTYKPEAAKAPLDSFELQMKRAQRDALRELKRKLTVDTSKTSSEVAIALEKYKDHLRNKIMDYAQRIEDKDFEAADKPLLQNDAEAKRLELELKRAETSFRQEKDAAEKANRTKLQKIYAKINQWKRFSVLTGIPTIGKLGGAVVYRTVFNPIEELTGTILHYVPLIRDVSMQAPREGGGINLKAEGLALHEWAKAETYKDAMDVIKTGQSALDHMAGGKFVTQPPEALEFMGRLHGAMKNFAKRMEFARSYEKRMQFAVDHGGDPADDLTQLTAMSQAYLDANRNIFMQDNWLVNLYNRAIRSGEESNNETAQTAAAIGRFLVPIVKIPTNFAGEALNYGFGSLRVAQVIAKAITGHLNDLSPEQADSLMRSMKKGTIGIGMMSLGFFMPGLAGGYYQSGVKKDSDEPDWDGIEIGGVKIPKWATHFPLFEAMQIGATMRQVMDKDIDKDVNSEEALGDGIIRSARGLVSETPLFNTYSEIDQSISTGHVLDRWLYPELRSLIPLGVQNIANWTDVDTPGWFGDFTNQSGFDPTGETVKRKPEDPLQFFEYGLPGLRKNVPEK
jgi:hypothetical protein